MNGLRFPSLPQQLDFLINKPGTMLNRVENRFKLELNSWSPLLGGFVFGKFRLNRTVGDQLLGYLFNLLSNFLDSLRSRSWYGEPVLLGSCPEDDPRPIRRTGSEDIGLTQNPQPRDHVCVLRVLLLVHVFGEAPE